MRRRRWLVALPLSTALHALGLLALLWLVWRAVELPPLFVDVSTLDLERERSTPRTRDDPPAMREERGGARPAASVGSRGGSRGLPPARVPAAPPPDVNTPDARKVPSAAPPTEASRASLPPMAREERQEAQVPVAEPVRPVPPPTGERPIVAADPSARGPIPMPSPLAAPSQGPSSESSAPRASGAGESERRGPALTGVPGRPESGRGAGSEQGGGSGRETSGSAPVTSGVGPGAGGSEYGPYLGQWRRRIHENLRYPLAARRRSLTGTVQLDIVIQPNGVVASVQVAESSSHGLLDEAAMEAVRGLSPLPFPSHLVPRPLRARLPVVFDLQ